MALRTPLLQDQKPSDYTEEKLIALLTNLKNNAESDFLKKALNDILNDTNSITCASVFPKLRNAENELHEILVPIREELIRDECKGYGSAGIIAAVGSILCCLKIPCAWISCGIAASVAGYTLSNTVKKTPFPELHDAQRLSEVIQSIRSYLDWSTPLATVPQILFQAPYPVLTVSAPSYETQKPLLATSIRS